VRNFLLKRGSDNIDIATDATPDQVEAILSQAKIKTKPVGKEFGSILAVVNKQKIEITTFRTEGRYSDQRHPDQVSFVADYLQDAQRRDFTINALYFDPVNQFLYDPTQGMKDLRGKIIRFVGDARYRINEDALRMLRGVRLATQLGFRIENRAFSAIKNRSHLIQEISGERIKAELDKIMLSPNRIIGIRLAADLGLFRSFVPELEQLKKVSHKSKLYHLEGNVFEHTMLCLKSIQNESDLNLLYAVLLHDTGKASTGVRRQKPEGWVMSFPGHPAVSGEISKRLADRLKFPAQDRKLILWLILAHDDWTKLKTLEPEAVVSYILDPRFTLLHKVWGADIAGNIRKDASSSNHVKGYKLTSHLLRKIKSKSSLLKKFATGEMIMKYSKLPPGPELGKKIHAVKVKIILGEIKNLNDLKKFLVNSLDRNN
jgi:tRNA nucleotidyltransferase (CCA-adding enzyme)